MYKYNWKFLEYLEGTRAADSESPFFLLNQTGGRRMDSNLHMPSAASVPCQIGAAGKREFPCVDGGL